MLLYKEVPGWTWRRAVLKQEPTISRPVNMEYAITPRDHTSEFGNIVLESISDEINGNVPDMDDTAKGVLWECEVFSKLEAIPKSMRCTGQTLPCVCVCFCFSSIRLAGLRSLWETCLSSHMATHAAIFHTRARLEEDVDVQAWSLFAECPDVPLKWSMTIQTSCSSSKTSAKSGLLPEPVHRRIASISSRMAASRLK
jgi:hypothetical protein